MIPITFSQGKLVTPSFEIIIQNGTVRDQYTEQELLELNSMATPGTAHIPYRQGTILLGEFTLSVEQRNNLVGPAKLVYTDSSGREQTLDLELKSGMEGRIIGK